MPVNMDDLNASSPHVSPVAVGITSLTVEVDVKSAVGGVLSDIKDPGTACGIFDP